MDENITLEKALEVVYKEFYDEDKIRVFGMKGDTIDILVALGGDEFLKRFKKSREKKYLSDVEVSMLSDLKNLIHAIDKDTHKKFSELIDDRLAFDPEVEKYYLYVGDLEREED
jgi:hypothetical protein